MADGDLAQGVEHGHVWPEPVRAVLNELRPVDRPGQRDLRTNEEAPSPQQVRAPCSDLGRLESYLCSSLSNRTAPDSPESCSGNAVAALDRGMSEHAVLVCRPFRDWLPNVPEFDDAVILESKDVNGGPAAILRLLAHP